jgi:photosystem II stability/assembly factor-like uncharacterized protein
VVGTSGNGIYLSTDAGVTWSSEDSGLPGGNINVLVVSGTEIYAGTDYGVFVSSDSGRRWTDAEVDSARVNVTALAANGADIFLRPQDTVSVRLPVRRESSCRQTKDKAGNPLTMGSIA